MTNLDDFDRSLGDFLTAGPVMAPEAPVVAALAHARTTPRRPDPFARLRTDVMARPRRGVLGIRPGVVLAAAALVAASIGVAVVGSRLNDPSVVPPGPSAVPGPTTSPAPSPVPSRPATFSADVPMIVAAGGPLTVRVTDTTGALQSATSLQTGDGMSIDPTTIKVEPDPSDPNALVVTWTGSPCETIGAVAVDEVGHLLSIARQACAGDATGFDRILRLEFPDPAAADAWSGTFVEDGLPSGPAPSAVAGGSFQPLGSPAIEPIRVVLTDEGGNEVLVDVVDESGRLASAITGPQGAGQGVAAFNATNDAPTVVRLVWPGKPCDTVYRLTIDDALAVDAPNADLTLDAPQCHGDSIGVDRSMILTFLDAVDATALNTIFYSGRGGIDMPTWTTAAPDANGEVYRVAVSDPGYVVDAVDGYFDLQEDSQKPGPNEFVMEEVDPDTARLVWNGPSCATDFELILDRTGETWTLWSAPCETSTTVLRMFEVSFTTPIASHMIKFEARVGEPRR